MNFPSFENPSICNIDPTPLYFGHLGGTSNIGDNNSWFPEMWAWLIQKFDIKSVLDVGCGIGLSQKFFKECDLLTHGVDCKEILEHHVLAGEGLCTAWDFTKDGAYLSKVHDMIWCCEVVEHIKEKFVNNIIWTLTKNCSKVLAMTAAPPGADGWHHVNCKSEDYWINLIEKHGMKFSNDLTKEAKDLCNDKFGRSKDNYFRRSGIIFIRN